MYVYFNGVWNSFMDENHPVNYKFFIDLFKLSFDTNIIIGNLENSDILLESLFGETYLTKKQWKYTFLFSGESIIPRNKNYTAIIAGLRTHDNIINCPFYVPYIYCNDLQLQGNNYTTSVIPSKFMCTFISNPNGSVRNNFIEKFEKYEYKKIDHFGKYKNNMKHDLGDKYYSKDLIAKISEYKFMICFENSQEDTYITEKIINPFLAKIIPIYWGSPQITNHFNSDRFLYLESTTDEHINNLIEKIMEIDEDDEKYLQIVNENINEIRNVSININTIANDLKRLIYKNELNKLNKLNKLNELTHVYCLCDPIIEPDRYVYLVEQFQDPEIGIGIPNFLITYLLPTYYNKFDTKLSMSVKINYELSNQKYKRKINHKEISLFLNFYLIFLYIINYYKSGKFLILKSNVILKNNIRYIHTICEGDQINKIIFTYKEIEKILPAMKKEIYTHGISDPIDMYFSNLVI